MTAGILLAANERQERASAMLGHATRLLLQTERAAFSLSSLKYWVVPAIQLSQIKVLFDPSGTPVAFLTWAFLSDDLASRMSTDELLALHFSEWNEGLHLWIIDFVAMPGHGFAAARWVMRHMFPEHLVASGFRAPRAARVGRTMTFRRAVPIAPLAECP